MQGSKKSLGVRHGLRVKASCAVILGHGISQVTVVRRGPTCGVRVKHTELWNKRQTQLKQRPAQYRAVHPASKLRPSRLQTSHMQHNNSNSATANIPPSRCTSRIPPHTHRLHRAPRSYRTPPNTLWLHRAPRTCPLCYTCSTTTRSLVPRSCLLLSRQSLSP